MDDDKAQLLRSLTIDRKGAPAAAPIRRSWPAAAAVTIVAAGAGLWFLAPQASVKGQAEPAASPAKPELAPAPATEPRRAGSLVASGYVVARRKATIAAEITGKVVETLVEEGMVVEAGQVIARLDSVLADKDLALAQSRANAAEAAIAAIDADLREAGRVFDRVQSLSQRAFASQADLTRAEARLAVLRAQLRQTEAQLATARLDAQRAAAVLDKHQIRAPFSGIVVERSAQPGEMISPMSAGGFTRTGICTIVDMDSIEIEVDVNEAFIGRVSPGTKVDAVLDAYPDWTIPATSSPSCRLPTGRRRRCGFASVCNRRTRASFRTWRSKSPSRRVAGRGACSPGSNPRRRIELILAYLTQAATTVTAKPSQGE